MTFQLSDNGALFFERQLTHVNTKLRNRRYKNLMARQVFPVSNEGSGLGTQFISNVGFDHTGVAKIVSDNDNTLNTVGVKAFEYQHPVRIYGCKVSYNIQDIEAEATAAKSPYGIYSGQRSIEAKTKASDRSMEELVDTVLWYGDASYNLPGLHTNDLIPISTAIGSTASDRLAENKANEAVLQELHSFVNGMARDSRSVHKGTTLLMPLSLYQYLATTIYNAVSSKTILQTFIESRNTIGENIEVVGLDDLEDAGTASTRRLVLLERSKENFEARVPVERRSLPPQRVNLNYESDMIGSISGLHVYYPLALRFLDGL